MLCVLTNLVVKESRRRLHGEYTMCGPMFTMAVWDLWIEEKHLLYQIIDLGLFCQHYKCMEVDSYSDNLDKNVERVVAAALCTPKTLKSLCRYVIRSAMPCSKVSDKEVHI